MLKDIVFRIFTYPLCIGLIILSSCLILDMIESQKFFNNLSAMLALPSIFILSMTYLITDIIIGITTFRKKKNNDNLK